MRDTYRVRYYECDMQRVVHNSVYLAWCDDGADRWFRAAGADLEAGPWDLMVKTATITWASASRLGDEITVDMAVSRWGNTSFDLAFTGTRDGDPVFEATITYVAVRTGTTETLRVPDEFREALDAG